MTHTLIERDDFRVPIRTWLPVEEIDQPTMTQLENAARHPDATAHIAVMPDAHVGFGIPIGTVLATADAVIPNAVGVDIGCGMCAVNTGLRYDADRMDRDFWRGGPRGLGGRCRPASRRTSRGSRWEIWTARCAPRRCSRWCGSEPRSSSARLVVATISWRRNETRAA